MPASAHTPRSLGAAALVLLALALAALVAPAAGLAAPPEGALPLTVSPLPVSFPTTTAGYQTPSQEIVLRNEGEEAAAIEKIFIDGEDASAFNLGGSDCGFLAQGQSCAVWISFVPGSAGEKRAAVHVQFSGGRPEQTFSFAGIAVSARLAFSPGGHDFGVQWVNSGGHETTFQLTNVGEAPVQLNNLDIVGPDSSAFWTGYSDCWGRWLAPEESCSVGANFGPRDTVAYTAYLRAGVNGESFTAELSGRGGRAIVAADPDPVAFGTATAGSQGSVRTITLTNSGNLGAAFFIGVIAGGDAGSFELLDENCSAAELAPGGGTCTAHVRFTPQGPGPKLARLAFFGEGEGGTMVALRGEGAAPALGLGPAGGHDFGAQVRGRTGPSAGFAVRNGGAAPVELGSVAIVGADPDQFLLATDACSGAVLAPGEECDVHVRFAPYSVGSKTATLRVGSDAGALTASLSGTATAPAESRASRVRRAAGRHRLIRREGIHAGWAHRYPPRP
jgi:hypothetical protein